MIGEIKTFLCEKCITVPEEWIPACLNFIKAEHGKNIGNVGWMKSKVLEQWLHADITELASCCLPFGLPNLKLTTIKGQFPLQVNSVKDVGLSAYNQLQKLKKSDIQNEGVSADVPHKAAWEPKPSRMLMLELTDGTSVVHGMEYSFIPCLSLNIKPGAKILVKGHIEARRGVLFLTQENVSLLGGEVESLLVPNAQENILNKALGLELTDTPTILPESCLQLDPSQLTNSTVPSQYYPTQTSQFTQKQNSFQNTYSNWSKPISNAISGSSRGMNAISFITSQRNIQASSDEFDDQDDFFDNETELAILEVERKMTNVSTNNISMLNNTNPDQFQSKPFQYESSKSLEINNKRNFQTFNKVQNSNTNNIITSSNLQKCNVKPCADNSNDFDDPLELDDDDILLAAEIDLSCLSKANPNTVKNSLTNLKSQNSFVSMQKKLKQSKITNFSAPIQETFHNSSGDNSCCPSQKYSEEFNVKEKIILGSRNISSSVKFSSANHVQNRPLFQNSFSVSSQNEEKVIKKRRLSPCFEVQSEDKKEIESKCAELDLKQKIQEMPAPFQYICMINLNPEQRTFYTIKGFVLTLISKLEREDDKWCLKAKINDGTGSCDMHIHDHILCRLIGMTVHDFITRKNEVKTNPALRNTMNQMVSNCQKELITMCCLLRLETGPHLTLPVITEIIPLTNTHCQQLLSRSMS